MSRNDRQAHEGLCHDIIHTTTERMERLRTRVERSPYGDREVAERALDTLRGLRNRAMAKVEAARMASDDAWPIARKQADEALATLARSVEALEASLIPSVAA